MTTHLTRAYEQMERGKSIELVDSSLDQHFKQLNCDAWNKAKQDEYYALYPLDRLPTQEEADAQYQEYLSTLLEGEIVIPATEFEYSNVPIEYTYCELVPFKPAVLDIDGNVIEPEVPEHYAPDACTLTYEQWLNGATCPDYDTTEDMLNFKATDEKYNGYSNSIKKDMLDKLTVTTSTGKVFYADAESRIDLSDAIGMAIENGLTETTWKLAEPVNGTKLVIVTLDEIREARTLALMAKGSIVGAV